MTLTGPLFRPEPGAVASAAADQTSTGPGFGTSSGEEPRTGAAPVRGFIPDMALKRCGSADQCRTRPRS